MTKRNKYTGRFSGVGVVCDFMRGLTIVGLARKYAKTKLEIENVIRRAMR